MADVEFRPDQLEVRAPEQGSTEVRLVWSRDTDERRVVILDKSQLPQVCAELQGQIEPGSGVPINLDSLRPGTTISVTGLQFGPRADHFRLTALADLPDQNRVVTIPLRFSKRDAEQCVNAMSQWLRTQP